MQARSIPTGRLAPALLTAVAVWATVVVQVQAQPLPLSFRQADSLLVQRNGSLLARQRGVDAARARIRSAGTMDNPVLSVELNAYNQAAGRPFVPEAGGQYTASIEQTVDVAGVRGRRVDAATAATESAEARVDEGLVSLRRDLHHAMIDLWQGSRRAAVLDSARALLGSLDAAADASATALPRQDVIRLRALALDIAAEHAVVERERDDARQRIRTLLDSASLDPAIVLPDVVTATVPQLDDEAIDRLLQQRPDLRMLDADRRERDADRRAERARAFPMPTVGAMFDRRGSAWDNYVALTVSVPLPIFDRNQGTIAAAEAAVAEARAELAAARAEARGAIVTALAHCRRQRRLLDQAALLADDAADDLLRQAAVAYQARALALLPFVDLFTAATTARRTLLSATADWYHACVDLNTAAATTILPLP